MDELISPELYINGIAYTYGNFAWKDQLTGYGDRTISCISRIKWDRVYAKSSIVC